MSSANCSVLCYLSSWWLRLSAVICFTAHNPLIPQTLHASPSNTPTQPIQPSFHRCAASLPQVHSELRRLLRRLRRLIYSLRLDLTTLSPSSFPRLVPSSASELIISFRVGSLFASCECDEMGSLYRSRTMSAVRLLMTEESAYDTIRHLGEWGHLMVVDLTAANPASQLSDRISRLKKRIGSCQYWEKRLQTLAGIMTEYGVELPDTVDEVRVVDVRRADVLEAAAAYIDPLDSAVSKNIQFKRDQTANIDSMIEAMYVLDALLHPDGQTAAQRRERSQSEEKEGSAHSTA